MSSNPANNPSRCLRFRAHGRSTDRALAGTRAVMALLSGLCRQRQQRHGPLVLSWLPEKAVGFGCVLFFYFLLLDRAGSHFQEKTFPLTWRTRKITATRCQSVLTLPTSALGTAVSTALLRPSAKRREPERSPFSCSSLLCCVSVSLCFLLWSST